MIASHANTLAVSGCQACQAPRWWRTPQAVLVGLVGLVAALPFYRYVSWLGDEGVLIHGAARMLRGEILYRDFFAIVPPGPYLVTAGWMALVGPSFLAIRLLAIAVLVAIAVATYAACYQATERPWVSTAVSLAWVISSQGSWTAINHHWFTTLLSVLAAFYLLKTVTCASGTRASAALAGVFAGAAVLFTPSRGAMILLVVVLALSLSAQRRLAVLALASSTSIAALLSCYLLATGTLGYAAAEAWTFATTRYAAIQSVPFGAGATLQTAPAVAFFPVAFAAAAASFRKSWLLRDDVLRVCALLAVGAFVACFPRPDAAHIAFGAPLGAMLLAFSVRRLQEYTRIPISALVMVLCIPSIVAWGFAVRAVVRAPLVVFPNGPIAAGSDTSPAQLQLLAQHPAIRASHQRFFFYPYDPMLPALTGRQHVAAWDIFVPGYTTPEQYHRACRQVLGTADWSVVDRMWTDPRHLHETWPALRDPDPREKRAFEWALSRGFDWILTTNRFLLGSKKPGAGPELCDQAPELGGSLGYVLQDRGPSF